MSISRDRTGGDFGSQELIASTGRPLQNVQTVTCRYLSQEDLEFQLGAMYCNEGGRVGYACTPVSGVDIWRAPVGHR
ncbi:unnamed protein product [Gordionus sp. m RMFG-2023]